MRRNLSIGSVMTIENLTHPGVAPVDGDLIRITHSNGAKEEKQYWTPVAPEPIIAPTKPWTKKEFLLKFTPSEYAAIKASAAVNPTLDYYWTMFNVAENVLKTDHSTIGGIQLIEAAGLIATGRAEDILA